MAFFPQNLDAQIKLAVEEAIADYEAARAWEKYENPKHHHHDGTNNAVMHRAVFFWLKKRTYRLPRCSLFQRTVCMN